MHYCAKGLSLVIAVVSATNQLLDAHEAPVRWALLARKPGRDPMIAQPDEITETEIFITQIPEILDKRFCDSVIARRQQLIGRQTSEPELAQRRNEIRTHTVVTQLLEIVEGKIRISRVGEAANELG